jgi:hypothetical protein
VPKEIRFDCITMDFMLINKETGIAMRPTVTPYVDLHSGLMIGFVVSSEAPSNSSLTQRTPTLALNANAKSEKTKGKIEMMWSILNQPPSNNVHGGIK